MGMICRPVLLHNEYVPSIVGKRDYEYLVLGHHDGMTIEEAIPIDMAGTFEEIFSLNARYEGTLSNYSTQFFFGFHEDNDIERNFWKKDLPFTFVSFVQFKGKELPEYKQYLESEGYIDAECRALGLSAQREDIKVIAYYELGNSNIILIIKCRICEIGTKIINNLHQDVGKCHPFSLCSSYSILAINRSYIEDNKKNMLIEGNIERLELRVIERKTGSVNGLSDKLENAFKGRAEGFKLERKGMLGTDDEAILMKNVPWKDFLCLYKEEDGILLNSNLSSQKYASAITTKILYSILFEKDKNDSIGEVKTFTDNSLKTYTPLCDYLYEKVNKIYTNQSEASLLAERKNLVMLINALRKIEYSYHADKPFNDYSFFTIMMPTAMFVRLRERDHNNSAEYYEFIKYIKLCMQNFTKPDRIYQQVTDFNIRYFDIPSKLITLYNAYLYYAKQVLNVRSAGQYEFLLCSGMNKKTEVKELYQGVDRICDENETVDTMKSHHLFRVEIPESHTYNLKLMFFTLGHEVSHFVGRTIRKRGDRFDSIISMSSRMVTIGLSEYIGNSGRFAQACFEKEIWEDIEAKIALWLRFYIEEHLNWRYMEEVEYNPDEASHDRIKKQIEYYTLFYRHTTTLKILLNNAINDILYNMRDELFDTLIWKDVDAAINSGQVSFEERGQYFEKQKAKIARCIESFARKRASATTDLTVENGIEDIMFLLEECYADMSCILLLHLSMKDYLENLVEILRTIGHKVEDVKETQIITRIAIVMAVMGYDMGSEEGENQCFTWEDDDVLPDGDSEVMSLQEEASDFAWAYIKNETVIKPGKMTGYVQRINLDNKILIEAVRYLLKCRREYNQSIHHEKERKVQRFYDLAEMSDPDEFFAGMEVILKEYEKDIYEEIQKLIESEEESHDE